MSSSPTNSSQLLFASISALLLLLGCDEKAEKEPGPAQPSASVAAVALPAPTPTPTPAPPPKPREDCPDGTSGIGTLGEPCLGRGDSRMMEVKYTGKTTDESPTFSVTNKSKKAILYSSV